MREKKKEISRYLYIGRTNMYAFNAGISAIIWGKRWARRIMPWERIIKI